MMTDGSSAASSSLMTRSVSFISKGSTTRILFDAGGLADLFNAHLFHNVPLQGFAGGGVLLMAGHAGNGVIHDDNGGDALVIGDVDQSGDAGMHKGGISDDRHRIFGAVNTPGLVKTVKAGDGSAHANGGIHREERRGSAQGIAADVAADHDAQFMQHIEYPSVRQPGHMTGGRIGTSSSKVSKGFSVPEQDLGHNALGKLPDEREHVLAVAGDAQTFDMGLDDGIQLFRHIDGFIFFSKSSISFTGMAVDKSSFKTPALSPNASLVY